MMDIYREKAKKYKYKYLKLKKELQGGFLDNKLLNDFIIKPLVPIASLIPKTNIYGDILSKTFNNSGSQDYFKNWEWDVRNKQEERKTFLDIKNNINNNTDTEKLMNYLHIIQTYNQDNETIILKNKIIDRIKTLNTQNEFYEKNNNEIKTETNIIKLIHWFYKIIRVITNDETFKVKEELIELRELIEEKIHTNINTETNIFELIIWIKEIDISIQHNYRVEHFIPNITKSLIHLYYEIIRKVSSIINTKTDVIQLVTWFNEFNILINEIHDITINDKITNVQVQIRDKIRSALSNIEPKTNIRELYSCLYEIYKIIRDNTIKKIKVHKFIIEVQTKIKEIISSIINTETDIIQLVTRLNEITWLNKMCIELVNHFLVSDSIKKLAKDFVVSDSIKELHQQIIEKVSSNIKTAKIYELKTCLVTIGKLIDNDKNGINILIQSDKIYKLYDEIYKLYDELYKLYNKIKIENETLYPFVKKQIEKHKKSKDINKLEGLLKTTALFIQPDKRSELETEINEEIKKLKDKDL